jgi:hypothetical protein
MRQYGNGFWGGMGSEDSDGCRSDVSDSNDTKASKKRKPHVVALVLVCVFLFVGTVAVGGILMGKKACQKGIRPADPTVSVTRPTRDSSDVLGVDDAVTDAGTPDSVDMLPPPEEQPQSAELGEEKPTELAEENGAVEQLRPEARSSRAGKFLRKNWKPVVAVAGAAAVGVGAHWIAQHGLPASQTFAHRSASPARDESESCLTYTGLANVALESSPKDAPWSPRLEEGVLRFLSPYYFDESEGGIHVYPKDCQTDIPEKELLDINKRAAEESLVNDIGWCDYNLEHVGFSLHKGIKRLKSSRSMDTLLDEYNGLVNTKIARGPSPWSFCNTEK